MGEFLIRKSKTNIKIDKSRLFLSLFSYSKFTLKSGRQLLSIVIVGGQAGNSTFSSNEWSYLIK